MNSKRYFSSSIALSFELLLTFAIIFFITFKNPYMCLLFLSDWSITLWSFVFVELKPEEELCWQLWRGDIVHVCCGVLNFRFWSLSQQIRCYLMFVKLTHRSQMVCRGSEGWHTYHFSWNCTASTVSSLLGEEEAVKPDLVGFDLIKSAFVVVQSFGKVISKMLLLSSLLVYLQGLYIYWKD